MPDAQLTFSVPFQWPSSASASNSGTTISLPDHTPRSRASPIGIGTAAGSVQFLAFRSSSMPNRFDCCYASSPTVRNSGVDGEVPQRPVGRAQNIVSVS